MDLIARPQGLTPAGVFLLLAACAPTPPAAESGGQYTSAVYSFTVEYPDSFDLREYIPEFVAIGRAEGEGFRAAVELSVEMGETEGADADTSFEQFVIERARVSCAADGPGMSLQCGDVIQRQPFSTRSGEPGIAFHLEHLTTRPGTAEVLDRDTRGPFFALALSPADREAEHAVLIIRPAVTLSPEQVDGALIRAIAESVR